MEGWVVVLEVAVSTGRIVVRLCRMGTDYNDMEDSSIISTITTTLGYYNRSMINLLLLSPKHVPYFVTFVFSNVGACTKASLENPFLMHLEMSS